MLYSIIPPEVVLDDATAPPDRVREVDVAPGVRLLVRTDQTGEWVERVIATDPRHYLNPDFWPGRPYRPQLRG